MSAATSRRSRAPRPARRAGDRSHSRQRRSSAPANHIRDKARLQILLHFPDHATPRHDETGSWDLPRECHTLFAIERTAGRASFITGRIPIRTSLSAVLAPAIPNGLTKQTPTIAQYLKQANYTTVQLGKWHVGDKPENFPTANGFDEMYDMLPYYAGVYAYADKELHPSFPYQRQIVHGAVGPGRSVPMGRRKRPAPRRRPVKKDFTYADLANRRRRDAGQGHRLAEGARQGCRIPSSCISASLKVHNPNNPSPRWKRKSPGGGNYLDALMELDDNSGPGGAGDPRSRHRPEHARGVDHR